MTPGSRIWRAALGLVALTVAAPAGCQSVPVAKLAPTPNRPQTTMAEVGRAALLPATVALETPSEMAAMEPVRYAQNTEPATRLAGDARTMFPKPSTPATPPPETPLLDEALARAKGIEAAIVEEMTPDPKPIPPAQPETIAPPVSPEPTKVEKVEPQPESKPEPTPAPAPVSLDDAWRDGIQKLTGVAQSQTGLAGSSKIPWALRSRVLAWLSEPDIDPNLDQTESREVRAVLRALTDGPTAANVRAEDIDAAIRVLEERAPLRIADVQLCLRADGFGDFQAIEPPVRKPGQSMVIYCELNNVRYEATGDGFRSRVVGEVELIPEGGTTPAWSETLGTGNETTRSRRRDYYINLLFKVPRTLAAGRYTLRVTARDLIADRAATRDVMLTVVRD